jgi:hypothetical protein
VLAIRSSPQAAMRIGCGLMPSLRKPSSALVRAFTLLQANQSRSFLAVDGQATVGRF